MADSNAPEHQDCALFDLLEKKKEDETHQQHPIVVDPQYAHGHLCDVHHAAPPPLPPVSHVHAVEKLKLHHSEGGLMATLHRSNSYSPISSSDEEGGEKGGEIKKKKGGLKEKLQGHKKQAEEHVKNTKEAVMEKIKEKLPGHKKEGEVQCEKKESFMIKIKEKFPGHLNKEH